jgi:predicted TIM-barrel fold metal-dependent hydrolase
VPPLVVDSHHHYIPRRVIDEVERYVPADVTVRRETDRVHLLRGPIRHMTIDPARWTDVERQVRDMDAAGVDVAVLSAAVFQQWMTMDAARIFNDEVAAIQARYPGRFVGLAHVPPFGEHGAVAELERAIRQLGLRGACITTSFRGKYPDEPDYWPFYRAAEALELPIFIHAAGCPVELGPLDRFGLAYTLGRGFDHTLVTARLLYGGVLEEFPHVRFMMGHLSGTFYAMVKRFLVEAPSRPINAIPKRAYMEQLRHIWVDTAPTTWQGTAEVRHALETLGSDRVCYGSDYPAGDALMRDGIELLESLHLGEREHALVCGANAKECFRF